MTECTKSNENIILSSSSNIRIEITSTQINIYEYINKQWQCPDTNKFTVDLSTIFSLSKIQIGSIEGESRSNAVYNNISAE